MTMYGREKGVMIRKCTGIFKLHEDITGSGLNILYMMVEHDSCGRQLSN